MSNQSVSTDTKNEKTKTFSGMKFSGMGSDKLFENLILEEFSDNRHGFPRISIEKIGKQRTLTGEHFTVPRPQDSWSAAPELHDYFKADLIKRTVSNIKQHC